MARCENERQGWSAPVLGKLSHHLHLRPRRPTQPPAALLGPFLRRPARIFASLQCVLAPSSRLHAPSARARPARKNFATPRASSSAREAGEGPSPCKSRGASIGGGRKGAFT